MPIQEQRPVANFNRILLKGYGDIVLTQAENESLILESEQSTLEKINTEVRDGTLVIEFTSWFGWLFSSHAPIKYTISVRTLESLTISGSGALQCSGLKTPVLSLHTSGSSQMDIEPLETNRLEIHISGSGKAGIAGKADEVQIHISGSGKILAPELQSRTTAIHISGSGEAVVNPAEKLEVRISGSGNVRYLGNPQVSKHISGSGSIQPAA